MLTDTRKSFGLVTILLHWACAGLIVFLFGLGLWMTDLTYYDPWYNRGPELHISLALLLLILMVLRVIWRLCSRGPQPLPSHTIAIRLASGITKYTLYLLVFVVIASGYFMTTGDGKTASLFGWVDFPSFGRLSGRQVDLLGNIHYWGACAIIVLAILHAGAAVMHHFFMRDRTLVRMIKPRSED